MAKFDYNEACPISMAASVICERWTLQIVREMFFGSTRYSEIQRYIPNISPSLLRNRLRFLEDQGIILRKKSASGNRWEYHLTPAGKSLAPVLTEMGKWGMRFASEGMTDKQNTAYGLLRDFAGALDLDQLPSGDNVICFDLTDVRESPRRFIQVKNGKTQVCDQDMGFNIDVYISSTLAVMTKVWYGNIGLHEAIDKGLVKVDAAPVYLRHITRWLRISSFTTDNPSIGVV